MTPYVIDKQKQLAIYFLFILGIIVSFAVGFVFGYQIGNPESAIHSPVVIEQPAEENPSVEKENEVTTEEAAQQSDKKNSVDQKKTEKLSSQKPPDKPSQKTSLKKTPEKQAVKQASQKKAVVIKQPAAVKQEKKIEVSKAPVKSAQPASKPKNPPVTSSQQQQPASTADNQKPEQSSSAGAATTTKETKKRYYSVQAGLFASRDNAAKFLDELLSNGFDAYMQDFVSSSGTVKYNVRFGRSESREASRQRLSEFRQAFSTPAYIVIGN